MPGGAGFLPSTVVYTINGTCIKNQGLLETFGQFASPPKGHQFFLGNVPGWNVAPWSLQRHLKWSNSSRYTKKWSTVKEILGPQNDLNSSGWNMIWYGMIWYDMIWFHMLFDLSRHMVLKSRNICFRHIGPSWYFKWKMERHFLEASTRDEECGIPRQWISHLQFKEESTVGYGGGSSRIQSGVPKMAA